MKKLIVTILVVLFCIGMVVGCAEPFGWYNVVGEVVMLSSLWAAVAVDRKKVKE